MSSARSRPPRPPSPSHSQVIELFLHVCGQLGASSDREIAELAEVTPENVAHWRSGQVQEFKLQTLEALKEGLSSRLKALKAAAGPNESSVLSRMSQVEVEDGASPTDLQRQFQELVSYDYVGHRFLYFEPHGALAWEKLVGSGYEQERWLAGVEQCAASWFDAKKTSSGEVTGPLASAIGFGRQQRLKGLDVISLGSGEGAKELVILRQLLALERSVGVRLPWLTFAPVDVSIPLLLTAATEARKLFSAERSGAKDISAVRPFCADFEEGRLSFAGRLASDDNDARSRRLVCLLGNTFGNLRDEERFVTEKLSVLMRPGDYAWVEVGLKQARLEDDPLFPLTQANRAETASEANRRILLEGPYRRWEAALGRRPAELESRVWVRENDESARLPGSLNFCHDLVFKEDRRVCTMLYSRRYELEPLTAWFERLGFTTERLLRVDDSRGRSRVVHLLLKRQ